MIRIFAWPTISILINYQTFFFRTQLLMDIGCCFKIVICLFTFVMKLCRQLLTQKRFMQILDYG